MDDRILSGATLAYLGDAVLELMVRETVLQSGITDPGKLNALAKNFVRAKAQSIGVNNILEIMNEEEHNVYRRGRNANGISVPKSASVSEYRRATGLEALFAHLYLTHQTERMDELFRAAFADAITALMNR